MNRFAASSIFSILCLLFLGILYKYIFYSVSFIPRHIVQISIPKSGTFMLSKCITALTNKQGASKNENQKIEHLQTYIPSMETFYNMINLPTDQFLMCHAYYSKQRADALNHKDFNTIFIYRDPRDQVVSFAFYLIEHKKWWPKVEHMTFDEILLDLITTGSVFGKSPPGITGINHLYSMYIPWITAKNVLSIRFEDLVGQQGGGTNQTQFYTIQKIAQYIGADQNPEKLNSIAKDLFGGTATYRRGQIGSWKTHFTQEHIKAFKEVAGNLLIQLGYEKDMNWQTPEYECAPSCLTTKNYSE